MRARTHPPHRKPAPLPCPRNAAHSRSSFFAIHSRLPPAPRHDAQHFPVTLPCPPLFRSLPAPRADFEPPSPEQSPPFPCQHTQKECPKALHCVMYFAAHRAVSRDLNGRIALSLLSEVTQPQRRRRLALALAHDAGDDQHDDGDEIRDHLDDLALRKGHADIVGHKVQHAEQYGA